MRVPGGVRKSFNVVMCLVAVAGIGWSGTALWQGVSGRMQINEACAGLVPAGRVLALSPAGGTVSHRVADEGTIELDAGLPQDCEIFSTEAGEKHHTSSGERWFFTGAVGVLPEDEPTMPEDWMDSPVSTFGPTYPDEPLGGGITGVVTDSGVSVELPCAQGEVAGGQPVEALWARASLMDPGPAFTDDGQLTAHDRNTLAETAVITANHLAEHLGCADRLPDPPGDIPALERGPVAAAGADADGTCAWYREAGYASRSGLPDQVLQSRTDPGARDESCVLVLGDGRAATLAGSEAARRADVDKPAYPGEWFVALHTYSGEQAKNVQLTDGDFDRPGTVAKPGKAGGGDNAAWWASSVCDGAPQIHTMTVAYGYHALETPALAKVFRTYVDDVTARRGCTETKFPADSAFRAE